MINGVSSPKEAWMTENSELLEVVLAANARYVDGAYLSLKHELVG